MRIAAFSGGLHHKNREHGSELAFLNTLLMTFPYTWVYICFPGPTPAVASFHPNVRVPLRKGGMKK
jgi:hypothetical protein